MTDAPNFAAILDQSMEALKKIPPLPAGSYLARIMSVEPTTAQKGTPGLKVKWSLMGAGQDVSQDQLDHYKSEGGQVEGEELEYTFWFTPKAQFMFKEFVENVLGIQAATVKEAVQQLQGKMAKLNITHNAVSNPGQDIRIYANIGSFAKYEA